MLNASPIATPEEIRFAYRLLLDREPDPAGLAHYTAMAATHRLTLAQLREILLASEEYRGRTRGRVINVDIGGCVVVVDPADPIFKALTRTGLQLPDHSTQIGSNLEGDQAYDQVAYFPTGAGARFTGKSGVFDFDGAVFAELWKTKTPVQFRSYIRYFLSDHRPLWAEFTV